MNSQQLLFINFVILAVILFFFFSGRSHRRKNTILDMRRGGAPNALEAQAPELPQLKASAQVLPVPGAEASVRDVGPVTVAARSTGVGRRRFFVYNGHEWEAHEVLSISPETSFVQVTERYQHLIRTSDPSTFEFYEAAYSALLSARKK